jgi:AbrB family looped-hinge helix DNA binding protein
MPGKLEETEATCCGSDSENSAAQGASCCKVDALITIDSRGQIVLPKDIRARAGIEGGDKLAVISWESDGRVCCLSLIKADEFGASIKGLLGPMMEEILQG